MSGRLDQEREKRVQPRRLSHAKHVLTRMGFEVTEVNHTLITFTYKGSTIRFWPYSGWHSGKTIRDGRGIKHLIKQLSNRTEDQHDRVQ